MSSPSLMGSCERLDGHERLSLPVDMGNGENAEAIFKGDLPVSRLEIQVDPLAVVDMGLTTACRSQAYLGQQYVEASIDDQSDTALVSIEAFTLRVLDRTAALARP